MSNHCSNFLNFVRGVIILVLVVFALSGIAFSKTSIPTELSNFRNQLVVEPEPGKKLLPAKKVIITETDVMVDPKYPSPDYYVFDLGEFKNVRVFDVSKEGKVIEIKITDEGNIKFGDRLYSLPASFEK